MNVDDIPDQFKQLVERARATLDQQIKTARRAVADLNAEKAAVATALAELKDQCRGAKAELDSALAHRDKAFSLATLGSEIAKERKELAKLKAETAKETTAQAALQKQCADGERRLVALGNEAQRMIAIRAEGEAAMADMKAKLAQVQIGR